MIESIMNAKTTEGVSADELKPQATDSDFKEQIDELSQQVESLEKELADAKDNTTRLNAQHVNQIRQLEKNFKTKEAFAISKFAKEVISIADVLETGLSHIEDQESEHFRGMQMTYDQLLHVLTQHDIHLMKAQGQKFNSEQHEALTTQETDELEPNHVLTVLQAGYMMKDRVLRHAKVIVSKEISKKS